MIIPLFATSTQTPQLGDEIKCYLDSIKLEAKADLIRDTGQKTKELSNLLIAYIIANMTSSDTGSIGNQIGQLLQSIGTESQDTQKIEQFADWVASHPKLWTPEMLSFLEEMNQGLKSLSPDQVVTSLKFPTGSQ